MKTILTNAFCAFIFGCITALPIHSQHLIVNLLSGQTEQYDVSEIQSIKFMTNSMVLYQNNGTVISWDIVDIFNYEFEISTLSAVDGEIKQSGALHIYPNPTSDRVQIEYNGMERSEVLIEVLNGDGKSIEVLYRGMHDEKTVVSWDIRSSALAAGTYLCRVSSSSKIVTGKIIVQ